MAGGLQLAPHPPPEVELVYISIANMGHILPAVEISRRLIARSSNRISITIILIKFLVNNYTVDSYIDSFKSQQSNPNLSLVEVSPPPDKLPDGSGVTRYVDSCREVIRQTLHDRYPQKMKQQHQQRRLAGLVVDLFCSNLTNLSEDLGVPSYMFFTSGANLLSFMLHFESLGIDVPAAYGGRLPDKTVVEISGFDNPIPLKVWPPIILAEDKRDRGAFLKLATQFRRTKGILVNTFDELEPSIIRSLASTTMTRPRGGDVDVNAVVPPVYPVGPVLNLREDPTNSTGKNRSILNWLDSQPHGSVVFLCFGGRGSFYEDQVREIATGLERTGQRFLWSLRRRPDSSRESNDVDVDVDVDVDGRTRTNRVKLLGLPGEYEDEDLNSVLPDGFLDRTSGVGRVIGWAPQVAVLAHKAVGAFVSHCGWNSITESLWFGVPIVAWPMFGEQQLNAFSLVREMGLAVELRMDYQCNFREYDKPNMLVTAEEVETGIRRIMMQGEEGDRVREKVKEISQLGKKAVLDPDHGSSNQTMDRFIQDVLRNINY